MGVTMARRLVAACLLLASAVLADYTPLPKPKDRVPIAIDSAEVQRAIPHALTRIKTLSEHYRDLSIVKVHSAETHPLQIGNGVKYILNVDIQGVPAPLYMNVSKHQVIVFEEDGTLTHGLAIDEFPEIVDFYSDEFW